jgi:hypothetical protein
VNFINEILGLDRKSVNIEEKEDYEYLFESSKIDYRLLTFLNAMKNSASNTGKKP